MPSQRTLSRLRVLHGWAGIVTGLLLFIVCLSGAALVFRHEIDLWANPRLAALPRAAQPAPLDAVLAQLHAHYPGASVQAIVLPDAVNPGYFAYVREAGSPARSTKLALRADNAALVGPVDSQLGQYLRSLHVFLFFGPRWIVGFLGLVLLVLISSGLVIHRKILAELGTLRWGRSLRLLLSDLHKCSAIWGLAFHLLIAGTGAWLGLAPLFSQGWAYLSASPGASAAATAASAARASARQTLATMPSLDALHSAARRALPGLQTRQLVLQDWGTGAARLRFSGQLAGHLASTGEVEFDAASARPTRVHDPRTQGLWALLDGLMEPLHFGDYGGLALKWLYFVLGLTPALLSLTGTLIWLQTRQPRPQHVGAGAGADARSGCTLAGR